MPAALWPRARRLKQALGGALRQSGVITAGLSYALDHHLGDVSADHRRARRLAEALSALPGVDVEPVETNLVFFSVPLPEAFLAGIAASGVRMGSVARTVSPGRQRLRACLHRDIDDAALDAVISAARAAVAI